MTAAPRRIAFIADGGPTVGGGHVMRCLTLARVLQMQGVDCVFLADPDVEKILMTFAPDMPRLEVRSMERNNLAPTLATLPVEALVFDHYGLGRVDHLALADSRPSLVIDDLANRPIGGDLVLDSGLHRRPLDYTLLTDGSAQLLLGPDYAPVRAEFAARRAEALTRRNSPVKRLLVTLGLMDVGGLTAQIIDRIRPRLGDIALDVVLGSQAPSLKSLTRIATHDRRITLHVDSPDMGQLIQDADLAIAAAGSTVWEVCSLGLPAILVVVAENQRQAAQALAARGAALLAEGTGDLLWGQIDRALVRLMTDSSLRAQVSEAAQRVCDGHGADRVSQALLDLIGSRAPI